MAGFAAGLGGFGSGYIQGAQAGASIASQRLMNAYRQLVMQQAQQEQQAQGLAGAYLGGGAPATAPGISPLPPISGIGGPMPSGPAPGSPPMPGQSSPPAAAIAPRQAPVMPSDEVAADVAADGTGTPAAAQAIANQNAPPAPADSGGAATPPAPQPAVPTAGAAGDQLGSHPLDAEIVQMVRSSIASSDPRPIAQAIKAARPDADDATVFKAAQMVMQLSQSGNKLEQAYLLQVMRDTMSRYKWQTPSASATLSAGVRQEEGAANRAAAAGRQQAGIAAAGERQDKNIAAADQRAQANREAMAARQKEREAAIDARASQSRADRRTATAFAQKYKALSGQLAAVKAAVDPIKGASPEQQKAMARIGQQMVKLWGEAGGAGVDLPRPSELSGP